ncbi:MAG: class I SAM-dependent methyltransferase [Planctomycetes bacterium]|nr:class I SAM-dependent methyltransferase [Planctomycetota bacterium]
MLPRILEPELMDTDEDAHQYDAMDHAAVNEVFVTDLLNDLTDWSLQRPVPTGATLHHVLDLGAGTAQIPIELARRAPHVHITAVDAVESMLARARKNIAAASLSDRITPMLADAKHLPFRADSFPFVISNSILHHIPNPRACLVEAIRVTTPGGLLFHRDLCRPHDETELDRIVSTYAADATPYQRKLFADSLRAALTLDEVQHLVASLGFAVETVRMTSDRHWTWTAAKK